MDLLLFVGIPVFGLILVRDAIRLSQHGNQIARVQETHATLYSRLAEYGFWFLRHTVIGVKQRQGRGARFRRALLSLGTFWLLFVPVLVAAQMANLSAVGHHTVAFAIGTAVWSFIVESPSLPYRIKIHTPTTTLVHPVAVASIIAALDLTIGAFAIAGAVGGATEAFAIGAAFVAAGDLISALIGLTVAAASTYPFKDPEPPPSVPANPVASANPGAAANPGPSAASQPTKSRWRARSEKWRGCLQSRVSRQRDEPHPKTKTRSRSRSNRDP
jgi:hypothetical protein